MQLSWISLLESHTGESFAVFFLLLRATEKVVLGAVFIALPSFMFGQQQLEQDIFQVY